MKKLIYVLMTTLFLAACGDDGGGGGGGGTAVTPLELQCINGSTNCNNANYGQYPGWMPYPGNFQYGVNYFNYFASNGFCGCPGGYMPAYNGSWGLGCVQNTYVQPYANFYFYWNLGLSNPYYYGSGYGYPSNNYPTNYPQYSNVNNTTYYNGSCTQNLAQSCFVNQANSCGSGRVCRQTSQGSNLGICTY